ncbi:hypothetical protein Hgul01_05384 [Herpetosiphon gulosus]|uniref:Uncharacterized protein n=2 Tax=Herpetosiphon gulosus TaxID=1973496 RepID=A0ABP9X862_9CHLR
MPTGLKQLIGIVVVVVVAALGGWAWTRTLPSANAEPVDPVVSLATVGFGHGYGIYGWDSGLQVVLVYDGGEPWMTCSGLVETKPTDSRRCIVPFANGQTVMWAISTVDGKTGTLVVNETSSALAQGTTVVHLVFVGDRLVVTQYQRSMARLQQRDARETVEELFAHDPELAPWAVVFR